MSTISLRKALGVLAKSSPFSVKTTSERPRDVYDKLKDYLYVKPEIEFEFERLLSTLRSGDCVFLCGSSGDGKSEILSHSYERYKKHYRFHLDATHSFSPHQSAIEALDELFDKRTQDRRPLVVGINIGMLANYAKEGADRHAELRSVIESFLSGGLRAEGAYYFLDFEAYPKFRFNDEEGGYSAFVRQLLCQLTEPSESNLFHFIAQSDEQCQLDAKLIANYRLLGREEVQEAIITTLFKTRLFKDQFITTRALLDLLHQLLTGDGYLFDNLFIGGSNELAQKIAEFDPAQLHTNAIDQFVLRYELGLPDPMLDAFLLSLAEIGVYFSEPREGKAPSLIRLFYLLKHCSFGNDYHHQFKGDFDEQLLESYACAWMLHGQYGGSSDAQNGLRQFYTKVLIPAIFTYANRHAPELGKREIFLGEFGGIKVAAPLDLKADYKRIQYEHVEKHDYFCAYLKVGESELSPMVIGLNLFELIGKLNCGYRPNRYDKNAIILLDEMVEQIRTLAKTSPRLSYYEGAYTYRLELDDEGITVDGRA
ncbi:MAG: DNA phosphorothioation-dependent restriction protein DptF [Aeromonadaceae bacterium]